ncbi:hypothetical protein [Embleya sp. NPDC001921]
MTTAVRTEQECKLTYALTTTPNPLTASPPNITPGTEDEHAFADIDIVISNTGNRPVRCSRIAIVLPVGSYARDLAVTGEGIDAYVSPEAEWTILDIQSDVLLAVPTAETAVFTPADDTAAASSTARFEMVPRSGREVDVDGLYIHLSGIKVSTKSGTARIDIEEWATDTEGSVPEVPNTMKLDVAKFPFRSGSDPHPGIGRALVALTGTGQPPATKIAAGAPVVLEWHHQRGDNHELYADGKRVGSSQAELEAIAGGSRWPIDAGLTRDTAFALKTATPTPASGHVVRWDHVTVCVSNPTLDALTVTNALQANGNVTANNSLTANGPVTVAADQTLTANGSIQANKGLTVAADQTLTANGLVQANKGLTVAADQTLTANGLVQANKGLTVAANQTLTANGPTVLKGLKAGSAEVTGNLTSASAEVTGKLSAGDATAGGKRVIRVDDRISLEVNSHDKELYLYCETGNRDNVYGGSNAYRNSKWKVHFEGIY